MSIHETDSRKCLCPEDGPCLKNGKQGHWVAGYWCREDTMNLSSHRQMRLPTPIGKIQNQER